MITKDFNINTFSVFIRDHIRQDNLLSLFNEVVAYYDASLGGCSCSRKTREKYAESKFIDIINKAPDEVFPLIKTIISSESPVTLEFKNKSGETFKKI
jgi:hypothetical protein